MFFYKKDRFVWGDFLQNEYQKNEISLKDLMTILEIIAGVLIKWCYAFMIF